MEKIIKRKKRYKDKKQRNFWIINTILVVTVLMLSISWSAFSQNLAINDLAAEVRIKADIRVTGITIDSVSDGASSTYEEYNVKNISTGATLPNKDSYIIYKIQVTNFGNVEMGIYDITGLPENLEYSLEEYKLKEKICVDGECKLGIQKDIYLKVKYKDGMFDKENITYPLNLVFDFRPIYKITYANFKINTSKYPQEIIEGDDLSVQFPNEIEQTHLKVYVNDINTEFQYDNYLLKLKNVLGNVVIQYRTLADRIMEIADGKTCYYVDDRWGPSYPNIIQTDTYCNGSEDTWDTPHYYKYIGGSKSCVNFNYVWYSGKMWRITEIFNDGSVKMITENVLTAINYGLEPDWEKSFIKQWLNEDFLDTLYNYEKIIKTNESWEISPWYSWCWHNATSTVTSTVGLLNPYEFSKTKTTGKDFYLDLGHSWWLSSPNLNGSSISNVTVDGVISSTGLPATAFGVRPAVVLRSDVKFKGSGTIDDPFILLDDKEAAEKGDKINTREEGELVNFNGMLYRIVSTKDYEGNQVTKLKSANYITEKDGSVMQKQFGPMDQYYTYGDIVDMKDNNYWPSYLNNVWLTDDMKKYLVEDTYYVDSVQDDVNWGSDIGSYKNAICEEKDTTKTTKECKKTTNTWKGYVGLSIVGELFAYPLGGNDVNDYLTATMTPYGNDASMIGTFDPTTQGIFQTSYDQYFAVKPTITLRDDVIIKSGDGKTPTTAFEIELPQK